MINNNNSMLANHESVRVVAVAMIVDSVFVRAVYKHLDGFHNARLVVQSIHARWVVGFSYEYHPWKNFVVFAVVHNHNH